MNELTVIEKRVNNNQRFDFDWKSSSSIKQLLDVIANIIAQEYINVAQGNPTLFTIKGKTL
jgi:hypothetical protein